MSADKVDNVIHVDFGREKRREIEAMAHFEDALRRYHQRQQFKTALSISAFSILIIGVMLVPFIIEVMVRP